MKTRILIVIVAALAGYIFFNMLATGIEADKQASQSSEPSAVLRQAVESNLNPLSDGFDPDAEKAKLLKMAADGRTIGALANADAENVKKALSPESLTVCGHPCLLRALEQAHWDEVDAIETIRSEGDDLAEGRARLLKHLRFLKSHGFDTEVANTVLSYYPEVEANVRKSLADCSLAMGEVDRLYSQISPIPIENTRSQYIKSTKVVVSEQ